jgi:hypothetical protein
MLETEVDEMSGSYPMAGKIVKSLISTIEIKMKIGI